MLRVKVPRYPLYVYLFWFVGFVSGIELIGAFLIPFFTDWGHLNQTQIQLLQSWFALWIFVAEVPTGVIGDVIGKKFSVLIGNLISIIGIVMYVLQPKMIFFLIGEFLLAIGAAFNSGSDTALLHDILRQYKMEKEFGVINTIYNNAFLVGLLLSAVLSSFVVKYFSLPTLFRSQAITFLLGFVIFLFVPDFEQRKKQESRSAFKLQVKAGKSLAPEYKKVFKKAINLLASNKILRYLIGYIVTLYVTSYFVIWFYQVALKALEVPLTYYGVFRFVLIGSQIVLSTVLALWIKRGLSSIKLITVSILVGIGFLVVGVIPSMVSVIIFLILSGGIGVQVRSFLSYDINKHISSDVRATVLSFISMIGKLILVIVNPIVGLGVDKLGVFKTLVLLGVVSLTAMFWGLKVKE